MKHLDIMHFPFYDLIFNGERTMEARFTKVRCAPFQKVNAGDVIYIKKCGGYILGEVTVKKALYFENPTPEDWSIIKKYHKQLCSHYEKDFWEKRKDAKYISLLFIDSPKKYAAPQIFIKKDRRGWVILP